MEVGDECVAEVHVVLMLYRSAVQCSAIRAVFEMWRSVVSCVFARVCYPPCCRHGCRPLQLRDAIAKQTASLDAAALQKVLDCESSAPVHSVCESRGAWVGRTDVAPLWCFLRAVCKEI